MLCPANPMLMATQSDKFEYIGDIGGTSSNSSTLSINKHASARNGDLMLALCAQNQATAAWPVMTGWTDYMGLSGNGMALRAMTRAVQAGDGASYSFNTAGTGTGKTNIGRILVFRKAVAELAGHGLYGLRVSAGTLDCPGLTVAGGFLIDFMFSEGTAASHSTPTGMTAIFQSAAASRSFSIFMQEVVAGATGVRTSTVAGISGDYTAAFPISIKRS